MFLNWNLDNYSSYRENKQRKHSHAQDIPDTVCYGRGLFAVTLDNGPSRASVLSAV